MTGKHHIVTSGASVLSMWSVCQICAEYGGVLEYAAKFVEHTLFTIPNGFAGVASVVARVSLCIFGSLLPDIDTPYSALGRFVCVPGGHRGWPHSIYPVIVLSLVSVIAHPMIWLVLGYLLHLLWDAPSVMGVAFLRPFSGYIVYNSGAKIKKKHWLKLYKTNGLSERIIVFLFTVLSVLLWGYVIARCFA